MGGMKLGLAKGAVFLGALLGISAVAYAQADPNVLITVTRQVGSETVSLSRPAPGRNKVALETWAAFKVTFYNGGQSDLRRVQFTGFAKTYESDGTTANSSLATYDSYVAGVSGITCTGSSNQVVCALPTNTPLPVGATIEWTVVFKTPSAGAKLDLEYTGGGSEGKGSGTGCCQQSGTSLLQVDLVDPATDPNVKLKAATFMRPNGFTLFTGAGGVTLPDDGWTTTITVPAFDTLLNNPARIAEVDLAASCQPYALGCFQSDVSLEGFSVPTPSPFDPVADAFKLIQITIRWDKNFFTLGNTRPEDVPLYYTDTKTPGALPKPLVLCTATNPPVSGVPCLAALPKVLKNSDTKDKDLWGDLEFRVLAVDNGRYTLL